VVHKNEASIFSEHIIFYNFYLRKTIEAGELLARMTLLDLKESIQDLKEDVRISELTDGVLLIDGELTILVIHSWSTKTTPRKEGFQPQLEVIQNEFNAVDRVLVSIEGTVLYIQGALSDFEVSYLPNFVGGIQTQDISTIIEDIFQGLLQTEPLPTTYLSDERIDDAIALLKNVHSADLTTYHTPKKVAEIAANWVCAGDRSSLIDVAAGGGELLTAGIDATGEPSQAWGIDNNGLASGITRSRSAEHDVPDDHIYCADFFRVYEDFLSDTQNISAQSRSKFTLSEFPVDGFDCILSHPPIGRESDHTSRNHSEGNQSEFRRFEHRFVHAACQMLSESGRGCFILPAHQLRELRNSVLPDGVQLKRLVKLPESIFPVIGVEPMLVCVERTTETEKLGVLNLHRIDDMVQTCGAVHSPQTADQLDFVDAVLVDPYLSTTTVQTLLSAPGAAPLFTEQYPTLTELTDNIATGMVTGHNRSFYFTESERAESDISDRFFTPVVKSLPTNKLEITDKDIDTYLFDLRGFVNNNGIDKHDFGEVSNTLSSIDTAAASHVSENLAPALQHKSNSKGVIPRSIPMTDPDLVTGANTDTVWWYQINIDAHEVLFNNSAVGIRCGDDVSVASLQTVLNTPLYQRLSDNSFPNLDAEYVRVQIGPLKRLPVILPYLSDEVIDRLASLSPYDSHETRTTAMTAILEDLKKPHRSTVAATYEAVSPLSSIEGYTTKVDRLQSVLAGKDTALELVDKDMISRLERTFRTTNVFETREQLIEELLVVYSEERYWSFMGGTAAQFEGLLQDYIMNTDGEVQYREDSDGDKKLYFKYRDGWKPLRLKILIDEFFSDSLWEVMQEVRKQRNEIAHGRLLNAPEKNAETLLLAFFIFTYALLYQYNNYLGAKGVSSR
jgi:hypothetical protein